MPISKLKTLTQLDKVLSNAGTFRDANGNINKAGLSAKAVIMADGFTTVESHFASQQEFMTTAINILKDGGDGTSLPANRNSLLKISESLDSTARLLDDFLSGAASDDGVMNRLIEFVNAIKDNKEGLDAILINKVNVTDIVNDLETDDATKVLSAAQGVALLTAIDGLRYQVNNSINALHTFENQDTLDKVTEQHVKLASKVVTETPETWPAEVRDDGVLYMFDPITAIEPEVK